MSLITCPDCHNSISDSAPSCPHCGRPFIVQSNAPPQQIIVKQPRKTSVVTMGCAAIAVLFLIVFIVTLFKGQNNTSAPQTPGIGQEALLNNGATLVYVAETEAALDAMLKAIQAKDKIGISNALMRTCGTKQNTKVLVIDRKTFKRQVRMLDGECTGRSGWVPNEWLKQ